MFKKKKKKNADNLYSTGDFSGTLLPCGGKMNRIIGFCITGQKWSLIVLMFNPILRDNSFYVPPFPPPPTWNTWIEIPIFLFPQTTLSSNHPLIAKTQLIILHANQLRTKTLANLHSRALALMREAHIQTIYLCNVYPFCFSSKIH